MEKRIAIIGGGPGGLSAAIRAAEIGLEVYLFERGEIGSGIKCAEGFIDTLGVLNKPVAGVLFKVERVNFFNGRAHYVNLPENLGLWMIDRATWQTSLAKKAARLGVDIRENCPIDKDQLNRMMGDYGFVIDASGAPSLTSKLFGFVPDYTKNATLLAQYAVESDFGFVGPNTILVGYERLFGNPLISCVLKSPELVRKIIFNKPPLPQLIGLNPSGRNITSRCNPSAK